jgi:multidrug transporter EmrE-like cation transporter
MEFSRVRAGELIAGISGVALFIIMFLPWFGVPEAAEELIEQLGGVGAVEDADTTANAWESFDFIDIVLLLAVIAGIGLAVLAAAQSSVQLPVAASAITAGLGILGTLLVLYRVIEPPSEASRKVGLFLGLIAVAGIAFGGWLAMQEEGTTFGGEADRLGGGGAAPGAGPPAPPPPPPPSTGT